MTKQSAETAKSREGSVYSIEKERRRNVHPIAKWRRNIYPIRKRPIAEMVTRLGDLQSSCSIDGGTHLRWRKSHFELYNPTQQAPKLTPRDTHQSIFHHRFFLKLHGVNWTLVSPHPFLTHFLVMPKKQIHKPCIFRRPNLWRRK
jgi:hypothetical protein